MCQSATIQRVEQGAFKGPLCLLKKFFNQLTTKMYLIYVHTNS